MSELINIDDLIALIGVEELSQIAGHGSHNTENGRTLDNEKIGAAISFADDMVKSYAAKRFPLLLTLASEDTPDMLKGYASDIARYRLRSRTGNRNSTSDEVETRYKDALTWLKDVSRGVVNLDLRDVDGGAANQAADVNPSGNINSYLPAGRAGDVLKGY